MTKDMKNGVMKKIYGQTVGQVASAKPVLIENPELLRLAQNGDTEVEVEVAEEQPERPAPGSAVKGPLDKQIEMKTSDGRRRITPIFIMPNSEAANPNMTSGNSMSCESVAKYQMQSSSSGAKSKIRIEKIDGVVDPNVSPGKVKVTSQDQSKKFGGGSAPSPAPVLKPNMIAIKRKPGPASSANPEISTSTANGSAPKAAATTTNNVTSSDTHGSNTNTDSSDSQPTKAKKKKDGNKDKKKSSNRIESDSDSSSSSGSDSSSTSSDDETASQTSKSGADTEKKSKKAVLQNGAGPTVKPIIVNNKRKAEDNPGSSLPPAKKRGRPPGSGTLTPVAKTAPVAAPAPPPPVVAPVPAPAPLLAAPSQPSPGLPPLALVNNRQNLHFAQLKVDSTVLNLFVHNDFTKTLYGSLHKVTANKTSDPSSPVIWDLMLPSPVTCLLSLTSHLLLTCRDATVHTLDRAGSRTIPAFSLPAPPHRVQVTGRLLAAVTTGARLYVWKLQPLPKIVIKNEEIGPLQRLGKKLSLVKMGFSKDDQPILTLR